jgi:hypothetical protein
MSERVAVTGGANRYPIFDRFGARLHVGDRLRAQCCVGRYGQTRIIETTVTDAHWDYCQMNTQGCVISAEFDFAADVLRCRHVHRDYEHGHETWAEVISDE